MKHLILIVAFLIGSSVSAKEIYTCKVNGSTVYQGKPCAGSKELTQQVNQTKQRISDREKRAAKEQAEWNARKEPQIGMTTDQVSKSTWGYPQRTSEHQSAHGTSEFWHYGAGRMAYFRNGVVVSLSK